MRVSINWWRVTGKWYAHAALEFPPKYMTSQEIKQHIIDEQHELNDGWLESDFYVSVDGDYRPNESVFVNRLFMPGNFKSMRRQRR